MRLTRIEQLHVYALLIVVTQIFAIRRNGAIIHRHVLRVSRKPPLVELRQWRFRAMGKEPCQARTKGQKQN